MVIDLSLADVGHGEVSLHAQIADGAFARRPRIDIQIQHLPDQIQRFNADAGMPLSVVQDGHQHHGARLLAVERLADRNGMCAHNIFL